MPAFMTNDGVVTEICPPCYRELSSATAVMEKGGLFRAHDYVEYSGVIGESDPAPLDCGNQCGKVRCCHAETRHEERAKFQRKSIQRRRGGRGCSN